MNMRFLGWIVPVALLVPAPVAACSCAWSGPLLAVSPAADLVVRAKVLGYHGRMRDIDLAMDVEVLEVFQGARGISRIRIWGDNGAQCRPYVKGFPAGTEWVFAIHRIKSEPGRKGEYFLKGCGEYWAKVENGTVLGRLSSPLPPGANDKPERMSIEEFRSRLREGKGFAQRHYHEPLVPSGLRRGRGLHTCYARAGRGEVYADTFVRFVKLQ